MQLFVHGVLKRHFVILFTLQIKFKTRRQMNMLPNPITWHACSPKVHAQNQSNLQKLGSHSDNLYVFSFQGQMKNAPMHMYLHYCTGPWLALAREGKCPPPPAPHPTPKFRVWLLPCGNNCFTAVPFFFCFIDCGATNRQRCTRWRRIAAAIRIMLSRFDFFFVFSFFYFRRKYDRERVDLGAQLSTNNQLCSPTRQYTFPVCELLWLSLLKR